MANQWFRSWHGAPTDPKWRLIAKKADVPTSLVVSFVWALMDRASQSDDRGSFAGIDLEVLAEYLDCDETQLKRIVTQCNARNITVTERFVTWEKRQPKREDNGSTDRVRAFRERQKNRGFEVDETQCNTTKRNATLDKDKDKDKNIGREETFPSARKRASRLPNDWIISAEEKTFAISEGLSPSQIDSEAEKFRDYWIGNGGLKADWIATWRNWVRKAKSFNGGSTVKSNSRQTVGAI
jgi:hypothetical protein